MIRVTKRKANINISFITDNKGLIFCLMDQALTIASQVKELAVGSAGLPQVVSDLAVDGYVRTGWRLGKLHKQRNEERLVAAMSKSILYFESEVAANAKGVLTGAVDGIVEQSAPRIMHLLRRRALMGEPGMYLYFLIVALCISYAEECSFEDVMSMLGCCLADEDVALERSLTAAAAEINDWAKKLAINSDYQEAWGKHLGMAGRAYGVGILDIPLLALSPPAGVYVPKDWKEAMCLRHLAQTGLLPHRTTTPAQKGFYVPLGLAPSGGYGRLLGADLRVLAWEDASKLLGSPIDSIDWKYKIAKSNIGDVGLLEANPEIDNLLEMLNVPTDRWGIVKWSLFESKCSCGSCKELTVSSARLSFQQVVSLPQDTCVTVRQFCTLIKLWLGYWAVTENTWFGNSILESHIVGVAKVKDWMNPNHHRYRMLSMESITPIGMSGQGLTFLNDARFAAALVSRNTSSFFVNGELLTDDGIWGAQYIIPQNTINVSASVVPSINYEVFEDDSTGEVRLEAEIRSLNPHLCLDLQFTGAEGQEASVTLGKHIPPFMENGVCLESCGAIERAQTVSAWGAGLGELVNDENNVPLIVWAHNNPMARLLSALTSIQRAYMQGTECLKCAYANAKHNNCTLLIDGLIDTNIN
jgi:hypothetical protein